MYIYIYIYICICIYIYMYVYILSSPLCRLLPVCKWKPIKFLPPPVFKQSYKIGGSFEPQLNAGLPPVILNFPQL